MSLEHGGRGDKEGNRYEDRFFAKLLLELILERLVSIEVEPLGYEGNGIEYVATAQDGERRYYQCKGSNGANTSWRPNDLERHSVFKRAKEHILSGDKCVYYFISPVPYDELDSLCNRTRSCGSTEEFFAEQITNLSLRNWKRYCETKFQASGDQLVYLLSHCYFELEPMGEEHRRGLEDIISILFVEKKSHSSETIRILLERFANDKSYWGKPIYASDVIGRLKDQGVYQRIIDQDNRFLPRLKELNRMYSERFQAIESNLIHRAETETVLQHICEGKSVILQGVAGAGKSGCIQEIIQEMESKDIPYLVLSLDRDQPEHSPDQYGQALGLPDSPVAALYRIAGGRRCVLLFDQLDALRWTNSRTSSMLDVCKSMLRQVQQFNHLESGQISCIFAVRTFDLETDLGLRNLLHPSAKAKADEFLWEKVTVNLLTEQDIKYIVGDAYSALSTRLKNLLRTPFHLFVWTQIRSESRNSVTTLFELMDEWWRQILKECESMGVDSDTASKYRSRLVAYMQNQETLFAPLLLFEDRNAIKALISCGILKSVERTVCFCHQSFLDYSLVEDNFRRLSYGEHLSALVGNTDRQTPDVRYQLLMLLQYLSETNRKMFLTVCQELLETPHIRYYFRCCAFEVLGQTPNPDKKFWGLLSTYFEIPEWHSRIVQTVFWGHPAFLRLLSECIPDYPWHEPEGRALLRSVVQIDPELVWAILEKSVMNLIQPYELYEIVSGCTITSSRVFLLRIKLLIDNAELLIQDFALYDLINYGYSQAIPVIEAWIRLDSDNRKNAHLPDEKRMETYAQHHYQSILSELLGTVLEVATAKPAIRYRSEWFARNPLVSTERQVVHFMQAALNQEAKKQPEQFFQYLSKWENFDSPIRQELFLHAMEWLPLNYADDVICWLLSDFDEHAFEETSIERSSLSCCQRIIHQFSPHCSSAVFDQLEQAIVCWNPPAEDMRADYQSRIAWHKTTNGGDFYIPFWGELQRILLPVLDPTRTKDHTKALIAVLKRKFPEIPTKFNLTHIEAAHYVSSPVDGHLDRIRDESWLKLVTDMSMWPPERNGKHWNSAIESTPVMFARSLSAAAKKEPARFAALSLKFPLNVYEGFAEAIVHAMESSVVPLPLTCEVLRRFCQKPSAQMAISFAGVLHKRAAENWPSDIIQNLVEIACHHTGPEQGSDPYSVDRENAKLSCDDLLQGSINCPRGCAFTTIAELLWQHSNDAIRFKTVLEDSVEDKNPAVLFAVLECIVPWYNIDKSFSRFLFDRLLERDLRIAGAPQAWELLSRFYKLNPKFYSERLESACQSSITDLKKRVAEMIATLVIMDCWPMESLLALPLTEQQLDVICRQAILHFAYEECHASCKQLLLWLTASNAKLSSLRLLVYDDRIRISRDRNFLIKLLRRECGHIIAKDVLHYFKETDANFNNCAEILFEACRALFDSKEHHAKYHMDDLIHCVARLSHVGKDDPDILRTCLDIWDTVFRSEPLAVQPLADLLEETPA